MKACRVTMTLHRFVFVHFALAAVGIAALAQQATVAPFVMTSASSEPMRRSFHLRATIRDLVQTVANAFEIQVTLDSSLSDMSVRFDVDDVSGAEAIDLVRLATNTFWVSLDAHRFLVATDTKQNRSRFERQMTDTFTFSGLSPVELLDMQTIARNILGTPQAMGQDSRSRVSMRAPGTQLDELRKLYTELFTESSELQLDVSVYAVSASRQNNEGVSLPNSATIFNVQSEINGVLASNSSAIEQIIASGLASASDYSAILAILIASGDLSGTVFNSPFVVFGGGLTETGVEWNSASANMLLNSTDVRSLNSVHLHLTDRQEATIRSGQRYPVIASTYTSSSTSSTSTATIPQIQYQDLGLTLKIKPCLQGEDKVALNFDLTIASLTGSTINDLPVLENRGFTEAISVGIGTSAVLVSAMSTQDALAITGIPGISDLPLLRDGTNKQDLKQKLDLVVLVTPHILHVAHHEFAEPMLLLPPH